MRIALLLLFISFQQAILAVENPLNEANPFTIPPDISVEGGTIDCNNPSIQIHGTSMTPNVTYSWVGPNSFQSDQQNPIVDMAGGYILTVTAPDGCTANAVAVVSEDKTEPNVYAGGGYIECTEDSIQLVGESSLPATLWSWTGPNGFTSNVQNPFAYEPGNYILTVTAENGCTKAAQGKVILDGELPDISVSGLELLDCNNEIIELSGSTTTMNTDSYWEGPNGFNSPDSDINISTPGTYIFYVTSQDGCVSVESISVNQDTILPMVGVVGDTLTCEQLEVTLEAISTDDNLDYLWQNSTGFLSNDSLVLISESGTYELIVTAENGCTVSETVMVFEDKVTPDISAVGGVIDCDNDSIQIVGTSMTENVVFQWGGPNSFESNEEMPFVQEEGNYTLTLTAENGCTSTEMVEVTLDLEEPDISATGGLLDCLNLEIEIEGNSQTNGVKWSWEGPNNFQSDLQNPMVVDSGYYNLTIEAINGCTNSTQVYVEMNMEIPDITTNGGILNCLNEEIEISGNSSQSVDYSWSGPSNFQSNISNPTISESGDYTLVVTAQNGCINQSILNIQEDFEIPNPTIEGDTITCQNPTITILGNSDLPNVSYVWEGPNNFESTLQNPIIGDSGTYILTLTAQNGCTNSASIFIEENTDFPVVSLSGGILTCAEPSLQLDLDTNEPNLIFNWNGPNAFQSDEQNPVISEGGDYQLSVIAPNGCVVNEMINIPMDTLSPDIQTNNGTLTCSILDIDLIGVSTTNNILYEWSDLNGVISNNPNININQAGNYTLIVTAENGCTNSILSTVDLDNTPPQITANAGTLTCATMEIQMIATSTDSNSSFEWIGPMSFISNNQNPFTTQAGQYTLTVIGENDCESNETIEVLEDTTLPNIQFEIPESLSCAVDIVTLDATGSDSGSDFQFYWTTSDGNFNDLENTLNPMVDEPGSYTLTISNTKNGCEDTQSMEVIYEEVGLDGADLIINEPTCWGDTNGNLFIKSVEGGMGPYVYSLDDGDFLDNPSFENLESGDYDLKIQDANGCEWESTINIPLATSILYTLNPNPDNSTILLGDSIQVDLDISILNDNLDSILWTPQFSSNNCINCTNPILKPYQTTTYSFEIITEKGCRTESEFTIFVDNTRPVFVPNVFSPNGDGINDQLVVFGGNQVAKINQFQVFDRWGEAMFSVQNISVNDYSNGWDGKFNGEIMKADVFVWFAEVEFIDGTIEMFKGEAILVR